MIIPSRKGKEETLIMIHQDKESFLDSKPAEGEAFQESKEEGESKYFEESMDKRKNDEILESDHESSELLEI